MPAAFLLRFFLAKGGNMAYTQGDGVWRTIRGRRVFIENGKSLYASMVRSGKFPEMNKPARTLQLPKKEYGHVMHELNTWYDSFKDEPRTAKCIGDYVYVFDNHGYNEYRFTRKYKIDQEITMYKQAEMRY